MTAAEKKISAFCTRHRLGYEWQTLKPSGRRAILETLDRYHHAKILRAAHRLKGIRTEGWTGDIAGAWKGYVYLQDAGCGIA